MIVPEQSTDLPLHDLVRLLKKIPKPDPEYWDIVEDFNRNQPLLPKSPWVR